MLDNFRAFRRKQPYLSPFSPSSEYFALFRVEFPKFNENNASRNCEFIFTRLVRFKIEFGKRCEFSGGMVREIGTVIQPVIINRIGQMWSVESCTGIGSMNFARHSKNLFVVGRLPKKSSIIRKYDKRGSALYKRSVTVKNLRKLTLQNIHRTYTDFSLHLLCAPQDCQWRIILPKTVTLDRLNNFFFFPPLLPFKSFNNLPRKIN